MERGSGTGEVERESRFPRKRNAARSARDTPPNGPRPFPRRQDPPRTGAGCAERVTGPPAGSGTVASTGSRGSVGHSAPAPARRSIAAIGTGSQSGR